MTLDLSLLDWVGIALVGLFSGLGNAIGAYVANRHIISRLPSTQQSANREVQRI